MPKHYTKDARATREIVSVDGYLFLKCIICDGARDCCISTHRCYCKDYEIEAQDLIEKLNAKNIPEQN